MKKSGIYTDGHWGPQPKDFKYGGATIRCNPRKLCPGTYAVLSLMRFEV